MRCSIFDRKKNMPACKPFSYSRLWNYEATSSSQSSGSDHEEMNIDSIWKEADDFRQELYMSSDYSSSSSDDDDFMHEQKKRKIRPIMVKLPCGDIHLCGGGHFCPYQVANEDRIMVCMYSGLEFGPEHTDEMFDLNGGVGKRSSDPDQSCGDPVGGKWAKRPDPMAASRAAYHAAESFDQDGAAYLKTMLLKPDPVKKFAKRGALCVGEKPEIKNEKKGRSSKKNTNDRKTVLTLLAEAENVLTNLINYDRTRSFKHKSHSGTKIERNKPPPDPRMCDEMFVFNTSVKKYVKCCIVKGIAPCMNTIHNMALMAQTLSAKAREEASTRASDAVRTVKFRTACANLIVALWSAVCSSPYMKNAKRGTDAYRPFICGCIYGFKRGVSLKDGTVIIPKFPQLAAVLPVLRGTGGNSIAKTLHSSSHRGLCTLSRCIASVPIENQKKVFEVVVRCSTVFLSTKFSENDI